MRLTAIFTAGPVRHMSVLTGSRTAAAADRHGQRPSESVEPGQEQVCGVPSETRQSSHHGQARPGAGASVSHGLGWSAAGVA